MSFVLLVLTFLLGFFSHKLTIEYRAWRISKEREHWRWKMLLREEIVGVLRLADKFYDPLNPKGEAEVLMEIAADYTSDVQLYALATVMAWAQKGRSADEIVQALRTAADSERKG